MRVKFKKIYRYLHISQIICSRLWFVLMEICLLTNLRVYILIGLTRDLKVDGCQSNLCYVKSIIVFYKFYDLFCRRYSLMNRPCHNNLFQFMQYDNFRNLNRVIFIYWKHLEYRANAFWYLLSVIKRYAFPYFMKSAPIPRTRALLKYCNCLIHAVIKV